MTARQIIACRACGATTDDNPTAITVLETTQRSIAIAASDENPATQGWDYDPDTYDEVWYETSEDIGFECRACMASGATFAETFEVRTVEEERPS